MKQSFPQNKRKLISHAKKGVEYRKNEQYK